MTRLYDENDRYTPEGLQLDAEISRAVEPIIAKYAAAGYSLRDIQNIAFSAMLDRVLYRLLKGRPK